MLAGHFTLSARKHSGASFAGLLTSVLTGVDRNPRCGRHSDRSSTVPVSLE
jgi:hypothetical protein